MCSACSDPANMLSITTIDVLSVKAVALYDYDAQRSDELNLIAGQRIKVLFKDNENWWMGELEDGQQGFFPSNYVAERTRKFLVNKSFSTVEQM